MKTTTNPLPPSLSSYDKIQNNMRNHNHHDNNNWIKNYFKSGLSPLFIWSLVLTSLLTLFLLRRTIPWKFANYSSSPPFLVSSPSLHLLHNNTPTTTLIKPQKNHDDDGDEKCDLYTGKWIPDLNVSRYSSTSCKTLPDSKNCIKHGRQDRDFLNWRWKPNGCDLPSFDPNKFLQIVRGKKMAFIGDSVARNHMESLLCLLSQAETPADVYADSEDRFHTWHFPSSNFTLMVFWTKFLVKADERMANNTGTGVFNLHLDKVDEKWTSKLPGLDYAVLSTAHWFNRPNFLYSEGNLTGCVYCHEANLTDFGLNYALRMSVRRALEYINDCKECQGMVTFVRTFSPAHFDLGSWDTGGTCNRTSPYSELNEGERKYDLDLRKVQVEEFERARNNSAKTGKEFRILDVTRAMLMRPDGHPGDYWGNKWMKGYRDCVHWCMPGPIDAWNDLLLAAMQKEVGYSE